MCFTKHSVNNCIRAPEQRVATSNQNIDLAKCLIFIETRKAKMIPGHHNSSCMFGLVLRFFALYHLYQNKSQQETRIICLLSVVVGVFLKSNRHWGRVCGSYPIISWSTLNASRVSLFSTYPYHN